MWEHPTEHVWFIIFISSKKTSLIDFLTYICIIIIDVYIFNILF